MLFFFVFLNEGSPENYVFTGPETVQKEQPSVDTLKEDARGDTNRLFYWDELWASCSFSLLKAACQGRSRAGGLTFNRTTLDEWLASRLYFRYGWHCSYLQVLGGC